MAKEAPRPPEHFLPNPHRTSEMPFDDIHRHLEDAVEKIKIPKVRHAGRSAWNHLRKAWTLHHVDDEMSLFRAITAEEEAATALIRALQIRDYPNLKLLNDRNHIHKSAIWPFINAVSDKMNEKNISLPNLALQVEGDPRIVLSIDIASQANLSTPLWGIPDEPFNWSVWSDRTGPFKLHDFAEEMEALASRKGAKTIGLYIKQEANKRNELIYASDKGIPTIFFKDSVLLDRRMRVTVMLTITIAIMQTRDHQQFFVQCLDSLLRAIERLDGLPLDLPRIDSSVPRIEIAEQSDGTMKASIIRPMYKYSFSYDFTARR